MHLTFESAYEYLSDSYYAYVRPYWLGGKGPSLTNSYLDLVSEPQQGSAITVSVLIAARNEEHTIGCALEALAKQTYPSGLLEVIVADGRSQDRTVELVRAFAENAPFRVRVLDNPKGGTASGLNAALRLAAGDVLCILGARAIPAPSFVQASVTTLQQSSADGAGGVVRARSSGFQSKLNALVLGSPFGVGGARYRYSTSAGDVDTINYGAYWRRVFEQAGGFDETMVNVEDDEFNYRLRARGGRLFLSPDIQCEYLVRTSTIALVQQFIRYGYPKARVLRRYPLQMRPRQFIPPALASSLLFSCIAAPWSPLGRQLLAGTVLVYSVSDAGVSAAIAARHGWRYLPFLPFVFAGIHLGYGYASLAGAFRWLVWPLLCRRREPACVPPVPRHGSSLHAP